MKYTEYYVIGGTNPVEGDILQRIEAENGDYINVIYDLSWDIYNTDLSNYPDMRYKRYSIDRDVFTPEEYDYYVKVLEVIKPVGRVKIKFQINGKGHKYYEHYTEKALNQAKQILEERAARREAKKNKKQVGA